MKKKILKIKLPESPNVVEIRQKLKGKHSSQIFCFIYKLFLENKKTNFNFAILSNQPFLEHISRDHIYKILNNFVSLKLLNKHKLRYKQVVFDLDLNGEKILTNNIEFALKKAGWDYE